MLVSTRGRYALRVMLELAQHGRDCYTALSSIASEQGISGKYLESIISTLSKGGLVEGVRGKGGGYRLTRPPEDYSVGEILRLAEGSLAPVACLDCGSDPCARAGSCRPRPLRGGTAEGKVCPGAPKQEQEKKRSARTMEGALWT